VKRVKPGKLKANPQALPSKKKEQLIEIAGVSPVDL